MFEIAQTTQPESPWTPTAVTGMVLSIIGGVATILIPGLILLINAVRKSERATVQSEQNSKQIAENRMVSTSQFQAMQSKVIDIAHAAQPPALPKVVPPKAADYINPKDL